MKNLLSGVYSSENWAILRKGFKNHGIKIFYYLFRMKWARLVEPDKPSQFPLILHVETTSRCNLRCPSCAHAEIGGVGEDMELEKLKKFIDQFPYVGKVILYGIGEPLLYRETFEMVRYCNERGIFCGFFTNGTLLTERIREQIVEGGQDYINFSIDGASKESFERQRAGANFEKVCANFRAMTDLIRTKKSPMKVLVWNCLTSENIVELPDLVKLTADLGVPKLVLQDIMFWNSTEIENRFSDKTLNFEKVRREEFLDRASSEAKKVGIELVLMMSAGDGKRRCSLPWFFSYVTAEGFATPCNWHGWDEKKLNFGNVFEEPFQKIWHSEEYVKFRKEMRAPQMPEYCHKCPMYDRTMVKL